ncbi:hypothetical protein BBJ28_00009248 [Nothophytophthora sp. Chile5]|nr:hypothetical protein BBJ28_00009248 [Nothophytophthora sp. Chile5]
MAAAPAGDIYCDERTYEDTKASLSYRGPVEMTVKGKVAQVRVFPVQRRPQSTEASSSTQHASESSYPAPFGCSDVLDAVPLFGSTAAQGNPSGSEARRALIVSGDSGTGKSMLLEHVMNHQHTRCFKGGGDPVDTGVSFHAWRNIAKAMAGTKVKLSQGKSVDSTSVAASATSSFTSLDSSSSSLTAHRPSHHGRPSRTSTLETFSEDWSDRELNIDSSSRALLDNSDAGQTESVARSPHHLPVLEYLELQQQVTKATLATLRDWFPYDDTKSLPASGEVSPSLASPEGGEDQEKTLKHVLFSMAAAVSAVKPVLLVFDDVQWMDDRSLSLVRQMIEELPNVFVLLAVRNIPLRTASNKSLLLGLVASLPGVNTRPLRCFSYQDTSLFLCQHFHIAIMDSKVLEFVFVRTEGNPAALIKLVAFMLDAQYVDIKAESGSIAILKDLDEMDTLVPQHMRARVMSLVHSLDALAQTTLKLLSINPQPTEERMINGVLVLLAAQNSDSSSHELNGVMLKMPEVPLLQQVRSSLAACEKTLLTLDAHNKLYFFNSEEVRLVVYDTMLPSQRTALHALFAEWLRDANDRQTAPAFAQIGSKRSNSSLSRIGSVRSARSARGDRVPRPLLFQQYALLGYHHSRSDDAKAALEAYHLAGERALEAKELGFAEDCMHSSYRILNTHPRASELSELDFILLRSRIEFIGGVIAVANSDWDLAVSHMSYITRLFHRKGSVLRRYTASIRVDGFTRSLANYSSRTSVMLSTAPELRKANTPGCGPPLGPLADSIAGLRPRPDRCLPRLFAFNDIYPSVFRSAARPKRPSPTVASIPPRLASRFGANRIQPEQTLQTLNQIHFYRRKASKLIKQINRSKKKQEEMHRQIQQLAQKSLQTKDKR